LTRAVARYGFKLMAYKDEYEVGRLHADPVFMERINAQFEGEFSVHFHLAPPLFSRRDANGHLVKRSYGPWMMPVFRLLARLRFLRGTALDVFGYTAERRDERALIREYVQTIGAILAKLDASNHAQAIELASIPEEIRGYGHIKEASLARARVRWGELRSAFDNAKQAPATARAA